MIGYFLFGVCSIGFGSLLMYKYKFYKHKSDDMLSAIKLKVFIGGVIFVLLGIFVIINEIFKLLKLNHL